MTASGFFSGVALYSGADEASCRLWSSQPELRLGIGQALAALDDVDGDDVRDVAIGVANLYSPSAPGAVRVCSGKGGKELYELSSDTLRRGAPGAIR